MRATFVRLLQAIVALLLLSAFGSAFEEFRTLSNVKYAKFQTKQIVVVNNRTNTRRALQIAHFRLVFRQEAFTSGLHLLSKSSLAGESPLSGIAQLACGSHLYQGSQDQLLIVSPPVVHHDPKVRYITNFLRSIPLLQDDHPDKVGSNRLEFFILTGDSSPSACNEKRFHHLQFDDLSSCNITFLDTKANILFDKTGQKLVGTAYFDSIKHPSQQPWTKAPDLHALELFDHCTDDHVKTGQHADDELISFIEVGTASGSSPRRGSSRDPDEILDDPNDPYDGDVTPEELEQCKGMAEAMDDVKDLMPILFESNHKVRSLLRSRVTSKQLFATIVDPIINQVPPIVVKIIVNTITMKLIELIFPPLCEILGKIFVPTAILGSFADLENVPNSDLPFDIPTQGPATDLLKQLSTDSVHPNYAALLQVAASFTPPNAITEQIKFKLGTQIGNILLENDVPQSVDLLESSLSTALRVIPGRTLTRSLVQTLTTTLTEALTHSLLNLLCDIFSRTLVRIPTRDITEHLTPALSFALSLTLQRSMARNPVADYLCFFCHQHQVYCDSCQAQLAEEYYKDFYTTYYANYYSSYFTKHYSAEIADWFVDNYRNQNPFGPDSVAPTNMAGTGPVPHLAPGNEWETAPNNDPEFGMNAGQAVAGAPPPVSSSPSSPMPM